jgi:preprotein translocase subunit SecB
MSHVYEVDSKDLDSARKVANVVMLEQVHFLQIQARRSHDSLDGPLGVAMRFETKSHDLVDSENKRFLVVIVSLAADFTSEDDTKATVELTACLRYRTPATEVPEEIRNESLPAFARINAPYNAWPYFRQQLQSATVDLGLPPFVLPPMVVRPASD